MTYYKLKILESGSVMIQKKGNIRIEFVLCPFFKGGECNSNCMMFNEPEQYNETQVMMEKCNTNEALFERFIDERVAIDDNQDSK